MQIQNAVITGSFSYNGVDLSSVTSSTSNISSINAITASILSTTASLNAASGSAITRLNALEVTSGSNITRIAALESASGSAITRLSSLESKTGSYATTGSNTFDGGQYLSSSFNPTGFSTTASLYTDGGLRVTKDAYISGTLYLNNVTVYGTQSVAYITSSQLNISTNLISVNTDTPSVRFGGLSVYDSGSTGLTGSILWDSENNKWIYSNPSGSSYSGGMFISGPRTSTLGSETGTTACMLLAGQGGDHLTSSMIYHDSTVTCIPTAIVGGGSISGTTLCTSNGIIGNNSNNLYLSSNNTAGEISFWGNQLNTRLMTINGGGCVGIGVSTPCKSLHVYSGGNEVAYFQGTTTGAWVDIKSGVSDLWSLGAADSCAFAIYNRTTGSTLFYLRNNGNLGIGTENPYSNAKFQVKTDTNINLAFQTGTTDITGIKLNAFIDNGSANVPFELNGNTLHFKTCEIPRLTFNGVGTACFACQVYIGTNRFCWTDTTFKTLQVGNGAFNNINNQTQIVNNIYYDDANYRSLIGGASNRLIMATSGNLFFEYACVSTAGSILSLDPKLFICGINGRVGLGTITPEYPLHIYCCSPLGIKVQTCGSSFGSPGINLLNGGVDTVLSATNNGLEIGTWSANDIIFKVTQVERLRINTAGIITMPFQPTMFAQPGASSFSVGGSGTTAYGWCTSGCVRFNCGFTFAAATSAANNVADASNTGKIIIPATGKYLLQFSQRNEGQTTSDGQFYLWVNGTMRIRRHIELWNGKPYIHVDVTAILPLNQGDSLEMGAWFNVSGKTDTFQGTADQVNWMSLAKIA